MRMKRCGGRARRIFSRFKDVLEYPQARPASRAVPRSRLAVCHVADLSSSDSSSSLVAGWLWSWLDPSRSASASSSVERRDSGRGDARLRFPPRARASVYREQFAPRTSTGSLSRGRPGFSMPAAARSTWWNGAGTKLAPAFISKGCPPLVEVPSDILQQTAPIPSRLRPSCGSMRLVRMRESSAASGKPVSPSA